jgi:chemotaxis regulatin CheY-phosphate phosphatase CheZ
MKHLKKYNEGMKTRDFIQETIDMLKESSEEVEKFWKQFQAGEIDKERFEREYHHIIADWLEEVVDNESHTPNNGCKYHDTCPTSEYFKKENI